MYSSLRSMSTLRPDDPAADQDMNVSDTGSVDGALGAAAPDAVGAAGAVGCPQAATSPAMALSGTRLRVPLRSARRENRPGERWSDMPHPPSSCTDFELPIAPPGMVGL